MTLNDSSSFRQAGKIRELITACGAYILVRVFHTTWYAFCYHVRCSGPESGPSSFNTFFDHLRSRGIRSVVRSVLQRRSVSSRHHLATSHTSATVTLTTKPASMTKMIANSFTSCSFPSHHFSHLPQTILPKTPRYLCSCLFQTKFSAPPPLWTRGGFKIVGSLLCIGLGLKTSVVSSSSMQPLASSIYWLIPSISPNSTARQNKVITISSNN